MYLFDWSSENKQSCCSCGTHLWASCCWDNCASVYFQMTFFLPLRSSLLKLPNISTLAYSELQRERLLKMWLRVSAITSRLLEVGWHLKYVLSILELNYLVWLSVLEIIRKKSRFLFKSLRRSRNCKTDHFASKIGRDRLRNVQEWKTRV